MQRNVDIVDIVDIVETPRGGHQQKIHIRARLPVPTGVIPFPSLRLPAGVTT